MNFTRIRTSFPRKYWLVRVITLLVLFGLSSNSPAYSVLTHQELIDLAWNGTIRPLLLEKFPGATEDELRVAHAYAYGGSAIQDMGYYPFGKAFFSNLTHYVRTGDFIAWLFRNAHTIDEYAFAIGALSHYLGDSIGHSQAINLATGVEFPKLRDKYGDSVSYDQGPHAHIRTEFAFDVDELTDAAFAPPAYMRHIGFKVPREFLERAFASTYGFDVHELVGRTHPALRSYRTTVRSFIPPFAEAEVVLHRHHFPAHPDSDAYHTFKERVAETNYDRHWKHTYKGPGIGAHLLAALVFIIPKVGAASDLAIKIPNTDTEELYLRSVNHTVDVLRATVEDIFHGAGAHPAIAHVRLLNVNPEHIDLPNIDLDTGYRVKRGDYPLADRTYAELLERLTSRPDRTIPRDLKQNIENFYDGYATSADAREPVKQQLAAVEAMPVVDGLR